MAFPEITARLVELKRAANLSSHDIGIRVGCTRQQIDRLLHGEAYIASVGARLALPLGDEVIELLRRETDMHHALAKLAVDADAAAMEITIAASPVEIVWTGAPDSLTPEETAVALQDASRKADWPRLLCPKALAKRLHLPGKGTHEQITILTAVGAKWIDLMQATAKVP